MANTATGAMKGNFIKVTFAGTGADWNPFTDTALPAETRGLGQLKVKSIAFVPSNSADHCFISETENGPSIFDHIGSYVQEYGDDGTWMRPFFDLSASSLNTAANAAIILEIA